MWSNVVVVLSPLIDFPSGFIQCPESMLIQAFHKTILQEFYQVSFRKKLYSTMEELQVDLDDRLLSQMGNTLLFTPTMMFPMIGL